MAEQAEENELPSCSFYRLSDVEKHRCCTSAWIVMHNKVYDVTTFLAEHPGGDEILLEQTGRDCTEIFESIGHSLDARLLAEKYVIGELHPDCRPKAQENSIVSEGKCFSWWGAWLIVLLSVVVAVAVYYVCNGTDQD
uniref:cytochrome b5-like n=1 Tax=Myxine glutinosa TaxID=7769 RepID=UPI00358F9C8C